MDKRLAEVSAPSGAVASADDALSQPTTTTISTVAVQAGKAKIVIAILRVSCLLNYI